MKKLALLAFALLPLSACQTVPPSPQQLAEAQEARDACTAAHQSDLNCVNAYLEAHYGWRVRAYADGSLEPQSAQSYDDRRPVYSAAGFGNSSLNTAYSSTSWQQQSYQHNFQH